MACWTNKPLAWAADLTYAAADALAELRERKDVPNSEKYLTKISKLDSSRQRLK